MMAADEIPLPEPIIQRVQYFLSSKEAARTTILSKSWDSAWLTRPNLDLDERDFGKANISSWDPFWMFADKTLKRYEDSNLKIESFGLRIVSSYPYDNTQITNMIVRALKLGATRLASYTGCSRDLVIPTEVFASENLVELTLERCEIDLGPNRDVIRCSRLQSLSLDFVKGKCYGEINFNDTLLHIISSCPLLEKLSLSHIYKLSGGGVIADGHGHDLIVLPRLRSLVLAAVEPTTLFIFTRGLSYNFPSLKDLTLKIYTWLKKSQENIELLISSPSLERLHLSTERKESWRFKFDVPSIRKFTYEGTSIPSLSFRSTSRGWESHVLIKHYKSLGTSWFRKLSKLLTKLRRSRIHLSLRIRSLLSFHYRVGEIQGLPKRMIENLTMDLEDMPSLNCYALLDGLFLMCRPNSITPLSNIDFIGETLLQAGLNRKISIPKQFMYGLKDLEEAKVRFFDLVVSQWRNVPLDAFLDDSARTPPEAKRDVRFQLKWQ